MMKYILAIFLCTSISAKEYSPWMREIIRHGHADAKLKCEKRGKGINGANSAVIDYQLTGKSVYVSRYHKKCEEVHCNVDFKNKKWKYNYAYLVCNMAKPQGFAKSERERIQLRNSRLAGDDFDKSSDKLFIKRLEKKIAGRTPASINAKIKKNTKFSAKKLNCQEFVSDINSWVVKLQPFDNIPKKFAPNGKLYTLTESLGTQNIVKKYRSGTRKIKSNLELSKVKLQVLESQTPVNEKLLNKNHQEFNNLTTILYQKYLDIAKKECFHELMNNRLEILSQTYKNNLNKKLTTESMIPNHEYFKKERKPAMDPILE